MNAKIRPFALSVALLLFAAIACAESPARTPAAQRDLGDIEFPTSGEPAAQSHFERGMLWLHSFEYEDARSEFRKALEVDPDYVMAVWGEALTFHHPIWVRQDVERGRRALERLGQGREARLSKAPTVRERGYLEAVEALFGEGTKEERDAAYAAAMGSLVERYPEDQEAASLYALAILGTAQGDRDFATYMRAAAIAEEVYRRNPRHPGALHYLIHSYDDPIHGPLGLRAARVYADVAPSAPHALHMPSHIFFALGMWDESAASNVDSFDAAAARGRRNDHALYWLHYTLLQQGRWNSARERLEFLVAELKDKDDPRGWRHLAYLRASHGVETGQWPSTPGDVEGKVDSSLVRAADLYAAGTMGWSKGNLPAAEAALARLKEVAGDLSEGDEAAFLAGQLEGRLLLYKGQSDEGIELLRRVADAEDNRSYEIGPPMPPKPTREVLGEGLLNLGRPAEARQEFEAVLERFPGRAWTLRSLIRALCKVEDFPAAHRAMGQLEGYRRNAEPGSEAIPTCDH
ncbi:MAG: tetratricopeptide repeat protein [Acidobacteriota bacterium]